MRFHKALGESRHRYPKHRSCQKKIKSKSKWTLTCSATSACIRGTLQQFNRMQTTSRSWIKSRQTVQLDVINLKTGLSKVEVSWKTLSSKIRVVLANTFYPNSVRWCIQSMTQIGTGKISIDVPYKDLMILGEDHPLKTSSLELEVLDHNRQQVQNSVSSKSAFKQLLARRSHWFKDKRSPSHNYILRKIKLN